MANIRSSASVLALAFGWALVLVSPSAAGARYEDTSASISYSGGWGRDSSRTWSGGTAMLSADAGDQAAFRFTGTTVNWIGGRGPYTGIANVFVDGNYYATVDTYSISEEIRVPMFTVNDLANTGHTLTIQVTGQQNGAASGAWIVIDAFDMPAVSISRLQETDPAVVYAGAWNQGDTQRSWSEGTAAWSVSASAQATFSFIGTAVTWIGARGPQTGIASVFLDGTHVADIDTYSSYEQIQAPLYTRNGLANTKHTLAIQATGRANAASSAPVVVVDGFDVTVPGKRYQDTDASIVYAPDGNWYRDTRDHAYNEGTVVEAVYGGSTATFSFVGTGVSFMSGVCGWCGIARISIDGGPPTTVDLYSPNGTGTPQKTVFRSSVLARGLHTMTVEVTGDKNPASGYYWVVVDAFDVTP